MTAAQPASGADPAFTLDKWSATSASNRPSRANLVLTGADRAWRAHASGNGAVDALLRAVDEALASVLGDGVELQTYNVHAAGEGHDTQAMVTVSLRLRSDDAQAPAYPGRGVHENVLEASVLAYVDAINRLVAHGRIDVAAAVPAPRATSRPVIEDEQAHRSHADRFTEMFNH
jgi:2-isopropylmalate synthase